MRLRKRDNCYYIQTVGQNEYEPINWVIFYWVWNFDISYEKCGYFDNRPRIRISLIFFSLTLVLPFRNQWTDECDPPKYGIAIHNNTIWIYRGGKGNMNGGNKWWTWDIPFITMEWFRTSILLNDDTWEHEYSKKFIKGSVSKDFYKKEWKSIQKVWEYDFTDSYDNTVVPTKIYVEEREWRPKWLVWTSLFAKTRRTIDIHFSKEVGKRKGSWKGGVLGTGYDLLTNEEPLDCLKRFEKAEKM